MALQVGDQIPSISLLHKNAEGVRKFSTDELKGKKSVLLLFPAVGTGVCTKEMCSVSEDWDAYKDLDAEVYGVSVDSPFAQGVWAEHYNITIPLLSDYNKELVSEFGAMYDVWLPGINDMKGVAKRSAFVIDPDGRIVYADIRENAGELPDFDNVKEVLEKI